MFHHMGIRFESAEYDKLRRMAFELDTGKSSVLRLLVRHADPAEVRALYEQEQEARRRPLPALDRGGE